MGMLAKIRRMHIRDGLSIREIARQTGLSRNTIRHWLRQPAMQEPHYPARQVISILDPWAEPWEKVEGSTFDDFVERFSWSKVNTVGPIFDLKKLDWLNGHYIRSLSADALADRIAALKPRDGGDFGTTEQWRHYNSLYFPYVVGVRAYAQNATAAGLDPVARQAWQWFVTEVPQRSLHNWQNAAARVIAADLRGTPVSTLT